LLSLIVSFSLSIIFMFIVFFITVGTIQKTLASTYHYPEYYVQKKISITESFDKVENFLSIQWFFNMFTLIVMCFYSIERYLKCLFKVKKKIIKNIINITLGIVAIFSALKLFPTSIHAIKFMKDIFPSYFFTIIFGILLIDSLIIFIKKKKSTS